MTNIVELPEDCLIQILSLTSPKDVVVLSTMSKQFLSLSVSDTVWDKFLPSDCDDIIARSFSPVPYPQSASKKDLCIHLCNFPILSEKSTKSFSLDKWSGKICYMVGARTLDITWGDRREYWRWGLIPQSRFPECAKLERVCLLEIRGRIHTTLLSPNTTYGAYFVFKLTADHYNIGRTPMKVWFSRDHHHTSGIDRFYFKPPEPRYNLDVKPEELPTVRGDGWKEIEMVRFQIGSGDKSQRAVLDILLREIDNPNWKSGLVVQGIELRPLS